MRPRPFSSHLRSAMFAAKRGCCRHRRCPRGTSPGPRRGERQRDGSAARHAGNRVGRPGRRPGERADGGITWRGVVPREAGERCNRRSVAARLLDPNAAARGAQTVAVRIRWRARLDCGDQYAKHPGVGDATAGDVLREGQCCVPCQYSLAERRIRPGPRPNAARQRRQRAGCAGGRVRRHPDTTADDIVRTIGGSAVCVRCRVLCDLVRPRTTDRSVRVLSPAIRAARTPADRCSAAAAGTRDAARGACPRRCGCRPSL